jgi:hypothetical protein
MIDGRTGFICRSMEEMLASVQKIDRLDMRACRVHVAERFSVEKWPMAAKPPPGG